MCEDVENEATCVCCSSVAEAVAEDSYGNRVAVCESCKAGLLTGALQLPYNSDSWE